MVSIWPKPPPQHTDARLSCEVRRRQHSDLRMQGLTVDCWLQLGFQRFARHTGRILKELVAPLPDWLGCGSNSCAGSIKVFSPLIATSCHCRTENPIIAAVRFDLPLRTRTFVGRLISSPCYKQINFANARRAGSRKSKHGCQTIIGRRSPHASPELVLIERVE